MAKLHKISLASIGIIALFIITRLFIWINRPEDFTQIISVYMPYAHLWASGYIPYLKQMYEYPPATIPIFYLPHLIDMATNNHWYHLNYAQTYRGLMLLCDMSLFALIWTALRKFKVSQPVFLVSLIYYSLVTAKTNHFIYDSFDLIFVAVMLLGIVAPMIWKRRGIFISWLSYFLAIAIKYVNAPLGLISGISDRKHWKKMILLIGLTGLIIWGFPIFYFRRALLVTFVYHKNRGIQVESAPATIVRTIDQYTHTEHFAEVAQSVEIQGPVTDQVKKIFGLLFPASIGLYILTISWITWKQSSPLTESNQLWITLGFICLIMFTSTVLSTPYLLWHIPFVAVLPTKSIQTKLKFALPSLLIIIAGMTNIPNLQLGPLTAHIWIGWIKIVGFAFMFSLVINQLRKSRLTNTTL